MKKLSLSLFICLFFVTGAKAKNSDTFEYCKAIEGVSATIMQKRQAGVTMLKAMEIAREDTYKDVQDLLESIIEMAYDEPMWSTEHNKEKAVIKFRNLWFKSCIKKLKEIEDNK